MIKFHFYIAQLCSQCAENVNPIIGIGACCYNRSLIFVLRFAISFRGYIAEILGDPYTKKSPLPRIGEPSSHLPVAPSLEYPTMPPASSSKVLRAPARRGGIRRAPKTKIYNFETGE